MAAPSSGRFTLDICSVILARIPSIRDKLAFASTCRAAWQAKSLPEVWNSAEVTGPYEGKWQPDYAMQALKPHEALIESLSGTSEPSAWVAHDLREWQKVWSRMTSLRRLTWRLPSHALHLPLYVRRSTLPRSLEELHLDILWDPRGGTLISDDLDTLTRRCWDEKLSSLTFKAEPFPKDIQKLVTLVMLTEMDLHLEEAKFPRLEFFHCSGCICMGPLHAPNLTSIILQPSGTDRPVDWGVFGCCRRLESIHVTTGHLFDCRGCSFPSSLRHLWLCAGHLQEDGCFSCVPRGLPDLETLHISFCFKPPSIVQQILFLGWDSRNCDFDIDNNLLSIYMPPQHDAVWAAKHPGWLGKSRSLAQ